MTAKVVYRVLQAEVPDRPALLERDEFRYGAKILYACGPAPIEPVQVDGVVLHSTLDDAQYFIGTSNPLLDHLGAFRKIEHDKFFEAELVRAAAPEAYARTELVSRVWPLTSHVELTGVEADARLTELEHAMKQRYPGGFVLKPLSSFSTDGQFPSERTPFVPLYAAFLVEAKPEMARLKEERADEVDAHLELKKLPSYMGRILDAVLHEPETVMIQERLDIAMVDGVVDEYRVHVVDGEILDGATEHRWNSYRSLVPERVQAAEDLVRSVIQRLPAPYNVLTYGADVVRLNDGSMRFMEANPGWESQYFYAEYDVWVANLLAARYAGAPTELLGRFSRFQRARSIPTKLGHLRQLLAHRALNDPDGDRSSVTELLAQAAHVLMSVISRATKPDRDLLLAAIADFKLEEYLSHEELSELRECQPPTTAATTA